MFETAIRLDPALFEAYYFCARTYVAQGKPAADALGGLLAHIKEG